MTRLLTTRRLCVLYPRCASDYASYATAAQGKATMEAEQSVAQHYTHGSLEQAVFGALSASGHDLVSHGRYVTFQMAEVAVPRQMFAEILSRSPACVAPPEPA